MDKKAERIQKKSQRQHLEISKVCARAGEADRRIFVKMPKHLFSGKRGIGKTDRRWTRILLLHIFKINKFNLCKFTLKSLMH